jgi:cellulose synthase/poly-beta-1,6-N-acetylglucosamine synthase-like glycosyltransferase
MAKKPVTIISLAWNKYDMTEEFLGRLKAYTDIPHKLIFTDNGSREPISKLVKDIYPDAKLITKKENVGCPATRNEAFKFVDTDIVFFLDNDTMVGPEWYEPILEKLKDDSIGISGPRGCVVINPWTPSEPFEPIDEGDCDYFVGFLMGMKTKYWKPINDYKLAVNIDDVEICWGVKENGGRAVISGPCAAEHLTSQTERGWEKNSPMDDLWANWPDKSIFERYK